MSGLWSGAVMQPHQLHQLQQQQLQQQLMLGGHPGGNMGPIVGHQHQSPPGLGPLNMMIGPGPVGGQHGVSMGHMFPVQSPPSSSGQFLHLPQQQQQQPRQLGDTVITPNSTPGLQTPTPSATPPIVNIDNRDNLFHNRIVPGQDFEAIGDIDPMMGWRGLQALQGGTIADMFTGVDRQFGLLGNNLERQAGMEPRHPAPGFPGPGLPVSGFNNFSVAMAQAQQAQENMMRLQQLQQQNPDFLNKQQQQHHQLPGFPGAHPIPGPGPEMTRHFPGLPPPQCQSPSPNGFSLPPGPRPRPVGGDSSPPGFPADAIPSNIAEDIGHHLQAPSKGPEQPLVIGSWNDECDKDDLGAPSLPPLNAPPPSLPPHSTAFNVPPPRRVGADQEWGGTFQIPQGGGHAWGAVEEFQASDFKKMDSNFELGRPDQAGDSFRGKRGGRGGAPRGAPRGRGGFQSKPGMDHTRERDQGKSAAIEETKALLAKMRLEDKELMAKNKRPGDGSEREKVPIQPGAYRPRDNRRGRGDGGDRGGRGRGRGRGGMMPHPHQPPMNMMRMPFIPGDFRTPPFPGMEGFLPPGGMGQFPPQFPAGFPPGLFPMGIAEMRGRGGFNRGRGFPIGFPPRGFPPPVWEPGFRGRGGRGRGQFGGPRNRDFNKRENANQEPNTENPMMSAIYGNNENEEGADVQENKPENAEKEEEQEEKEELKEEETPTEVETKA